MYLFGKQGERSRSILGILLSRRPIRKNPGSLAASFSDKAHPPEREILVVKPRTAAVLQGCRAREGVRHPGNASRVSLLSPGNSAFDLNDQEPHPLVIGRVEPEQPLEDLLGLLEAVETPQAEPVAVQAAQKGAVVERPHGRSPSKPGGKDNSPMRTPPRSDEGQDLLHPENAQSCSWSPYASMVISSIRSSRAASFFLYPSTFVISHPLHLNRLPPR